MWCIKMIEVHRIRGLNLSEIRTKWITDLPYLDIGFNDLRKMINGAMRYLHRMDRISSYMDYRFVLSKNDKRLMKNKSVKICVDLGKIKMKRGTTHAYHAFFVKDCYE